MGKPPTKAVLGSAVAVLALAACSSGGGSSPPPPPPTIASVTPASGPATGGTGVVVQGTGFRPGATVSLGGANATISGFATTSIGILSPPHAVGTVGVTVTNADGTSATRAGAFRYLGPAPFVTTVSPGSGSIAGGTPVTLTGTNFQAGATVQFGGTPATVAASSATSITAVTPSHALAGAVDVTVTNPDGQDVTMVGGFTYFSTPPVTRRVTISWNANHEKGVNQAGGGYRVSVTGQAPITVPWVSGVLAPTSTDVNLATGSYTVTVTAFAALDAQGSTTGSGSTSAASQSINVVVP